MDRYLLASPPHVTTTSLAHLDAERYHLVNHALMAVLASDAAEATFAQIIDGAPTRLIFEQNTGMQSWEPGIVSRDEPTPESRAIFREFRRRIQPASIALNSQVGSSFTVVISGLIMSITQTVQAYRSTQLSSRHFPLRLLEVAALATHSLGRLVYMSSHPGFDIHPREYDWSKYPHCPPNLYHQMYLDFSSYPNGLANLVGYWAETQIFGGVVLFEHEESVSDSRVIDLQSLVFESSV